MMRFPSILLALLLAWGLSAQEEAVPVPAEVLRIRLEESRQALAQCQAERQQLQETLELREQELAGLRRDYATILMDSDRLARTLVAQDLKAAHLLREAENGQAEAPDAVEMLAVLGDCRRLLLGLQEAWNKNRDAASAALEAAQASQTLRDQVGDGAEEVRKRLEECLAVVGLAAQVQALAVGSSAVLQVEPGPRLVLLDQGRLHGLREGSLLQWKRGGETLATLEVVLVRPTRAVAIPKEGDIRNLPPGTLLHRVAPSLP